MLHGPNEADVRLQSGRDGSRRLRAQRLASQAAEGGAGACPGARQVADRCHLIEDASAAFLDAVRRSIPRMRTTIGAATFDPSVLTSAEQRQHDGFSAPRSCQRDHTRLAEAGTPIKQIVYRTGHSRKVVRTVVCARIGGTMPAAKRPESSP